MKGWLALRHTPLSTTRFFFRLQWGFLSQHITESTAAISRYFIHSARMGGGRGRIVLKLSSTSVAFLREFYPRFVTGKLVLLPVEPREWQVWINCLGRARQRKVGEWYVLGRTLGEGSDGQVVQGVTIESRRRVAIKKVPLVPRGSETVSGRLYRVMREIQLQHKAALRSGHVAKVYDVFYDRQFCYLVLPFADMGSLSEYLDARNGRMEENVVREVIVQLAKCVLALHQADIVHRDVKCDNILLQFPANHGPVPHIWLCDFGFATVWRPEMERSQWDFCRLYVGTESYLAPEIVKKVRYGTPVDIFALGVVCHVCLVGTFPFETQRSGEAIRMMQRSELYDLDRSNVSVDAKSFCYALLNPDVNKRLTAAGLLQHRWLRRGENVASVPRRRSADIPMKSVFRRAFYVIYAIVKMRQSLGMAHGATPRRHQFHIQDRGEGVPWREAWSAGQLKLSAGQLRLNGFSRDAIER